MTTIRRFSFEDFDRVWFLTWTTYATWLPGDQRGFVSPKFDRSVTEARNNVPETPYDANHPDLYKLASSKVIGEPVLLNSEQANVVKNQLEETASYRHWQISVGAIMPNHFHLLVGVKGDPDPSASLRDFKRLPASGTWWTEQGSKRKVKDSIHSENVRRYVLKQMDHWLFGKVNEYSERLQGTDVPRSLGGLRD